jgi:acetylcholinesterase
MLFGTYDNGEGPVRQALEATTSETMQDMLLSFVRDPWSGPPSMGWPQFNPSAGNGGTLLRFGADGKAVQSVDANKVQAVCTGKGAYNPFP